MKIYTRAGDRGMTTFLGGTLVPKDHPRLEAYGTLDELNSWIGLLRDHLEQEDARADLLRIQNHLMAGASILASEKPGSEAALPRILGSDVKFLEERIDAMESELPALNKFILPGGHPAVGYCHLARTTCRRAERHSVPFIKNSEQTALLVKYLNRLSDYLFMLARKTGRDFKVEEITWNPEL